MNVCIYTKTQLKVAKCVCYVASMFSYLLKTVMYKTSALLRCTL